MPGSKRDQAARRGRVTISDVAAAAGTSTAVVSYVVNGGPRGVAPATRLRVLDAIDSLGYVKHRAAAALRRTQPQVVGMVLPDAANAFFSALRQAVELECFRRGLILVTASSLFDPDRERATVTRLQSLPVDVLIVVPGGDDYEPVEFPGPLVHLHRGPVDATVTLDNVTAGRLAASHLVEHGHRQLLLVAGTQTGPLAERERGWFEVLRASGAESTLVRTSLQREEVIHTVREAITAQPTITAVACATDEQAMGAMSALAALGRPAPSTSLIGVDGIAEGTTTFPVLTTVATPFTAMAQRAVKAAVDGDFTSDWTFAPTLRPGGSVQQC